MQCSPLNSAEDKLRAKQFNYLDIKRISLMQKQKNI